MSTADFGTPLLSVSKPDPVVIEVETVVDDSEFDSTPDPVVIESKAIPDVVGNTIQYNLKPNAKAS